MRGALIVIAVAVLAGCGGGSEQVVTPARVDPSLAPADLGHGLKLHANESDDTKQAFSNAGARSLVADGRVWEIRRADRLVGTLQISTLLPTVDLSDRSQQQSIVSQIIPGARSSIRIGDTEVFTVLLEEKAVFLWFGRDVYEVLQLKDKQIDDFEAIATTIIEHQATVPAWEPLPDLVGVDE